MSGHDQPCAAAAAAGPQTTVRDPVCGMTVDRAAEHVAEHAGQRFHFCSERCRRRFEDERSKYLEGAPEPMPGPMPEGTVYTCPMHPEIEQIGPGDCPICGMALEPRGVPAAEDGPNP